MVEGMEETLKASAHLPQPWPNVSTYSCRPLAIFLPALGLTQYTRLIVLAPSPRLWLTLDMLNKMLNKMHHVRGMIHV